MGAADLDDHIHPTAGRAFLHIVVAAAAAQRGLEAGVGDLSG